MTDPGSGADRGDADRPVRRASRRGVLAVGAAGLLSGCLVTSEEEDGAAAGQTDDGATGNGSGADGEGSGDDGERSGGDGGGSGGDGGGSGDGDAEATPEEVGPDGSGLVVTDATVLDVTESGGRTTVDARLTVENAGRFEYGVVEFRVDAYATPAGTDGREPVGFGYVTERFPSNRPFDGSRSREFRAEIRFPSRRSDVRAERDRYAVDAAIRRAEPI